MWSRCGLGFVCDYHLCKITIISDTPWGLLSVNPNGITGPAFVIGSSTATNLIVTNGANVGIGDTSPSTALEVAGTITTTDLECSDCIDTTDVDDDGSGACASGKVCTGGHTHAFTRLATNSCLGGAWSLATCKAEVAANYPGYVCVDIADNENYAACTLRHITTATS